MTMPQLLDALCHTINCNLFISHNLTKAWNEYVHHVTSAQLYLPQPGAFQIYYLPHTICPHSMTAVFLLVFFFFYPSENQ